MRVILSAKKVVTERRDVGQCMEDDVHVVVCLESRREERGGEEEIGGRSHNGSLYLLNILNCIGNNDC